MRDSDYDAFCAEVDTAYTLVRQVAPPVAKAVMFADLREYPLDVVRGAFAAHRKDPKRGQFPPVTADLMAQIQAYIAAADGHPGAEQAWAIAVTAADESRSLTWTDEIAEAWGIARVVYAEGDEVGARMAFKEAYSQIVFKARLRPNPQKARWYTSAGTGELHERVPETSDAMRLAVDRGLLPAPVSAPALPAPSEAEAGQAIEKLERKAIDKAPAAADALRALKASLVARKEGPSRDVQQRQQTQERKEQQAERAREAGVSLDECPGNVSDLMALAKARAARLAQGGGEKAA